MTRITRRGLFGMIAAIPLAGVAAATKFDVGQIRIPIRGLTSRSQAKRLANHYRMAYVQETTFGTVPRHWNCRSIPFPRFEL